MSIFVFAAGVTVGAAFASQIKGAALAAYVWAKVRLAKKA